MGEKKLVTASTPDGKTIVLPVVDLDGSATIGGDQKVAGTIPTVNSALAAVNDFTSGLKEALSKAAPDKTTVEFSISFAMKAGKLTALFVDGEAEGAVTVTMEWGKD